MNLANLLTAGRIAAIGCLLGVGIGFYDLEFGHQLTRVESSGLITAGLVGLGAGAYGVSQVKAGAAAAVQALTAKP